MTRRESQVLLALRSLALRGAAVQVQAVAVACALGVAVAVQNDNLLGQAAAGRVDFEAEHARGVTRRWRRRDQVVVRHEEDVRERRAEIGSVDICAQMRWNIKR